MESRDNELNQEEALEEEKTALAQVQGEEQETAEEAAEEAAEETPARGRNSILWFLGGIYLIYTAYQLISGFVKGNEGSSVWFCVIGVFFGATGAVLAYLGFKEMSKNQGQGGGLFGAARQQAEEAAEEPKRKLSIAEKARLAEKLEEPAEEEEVDG